MIKRLRVLLKNTPESEKYTAEGIYYIKDNKAMKAVLQYYSNVSNKWYDVEVIDESLVCGG